MEKDYESVQLSVSNKFLNCNNILKDLYKSGIASSITPNYSVVCRKGVCNIENGCRILFNSINKKELKGIWDRMKVDYKLTCAHIKIEPIFSGCILDFIKDSDCQN